MTKSHIKVLRMIKEQAPHMLTFEDRMMLRRDEMNRLQLRTLAQIILVPLLLVGMVWGFFVMLFSL